MTITDYRNFDLLITRSGDRFRAIVVESPAGEESASFDLPAAAGGLSDLGGLVRGTSRVMDPAPRPEAVPGPPSSLADLGQRLYTAIFPDKLSALLAASLSSVAEEGAGLRLRLRFEEDAAGLANLPWEILFDPAQAHFIGLGERSPILRYLALPRSRSALLVEPPLRVLALLASPNDLPALDVERERQAIQEALVGLTADGKFVLERLMTPTLAALQDRLLGDPVHILHFVGHGVFDEASQAGCLVLEDARGRPQLVRGEQLAALLRNHPAMRLAYLNACEGALASGGSVFTGLAQTLVREGLPAAVAMQAEISDAGAVELARAFYTALAAGRPVDAALTQARVALSVAGSPEWAIPVLFSRSPDNRLFDIRQVLPTPDCPYPGMTPFGEAQRDLFFGRDKEIEDAVERLRQHPFLAVVGPSGSGKSSLIYAGVIPALRRSKRFGPGAWDIKIMRPGDSRTADGKAAPMQALAQLLSLSPQSPVPNPQSPTLLFVDQFEETFTLAGADEAQAFLDALNGLIGRSNLHILLTVRADFYPELMASSLWQPIRANRLELTPLGDDALWAAIVEPAARVGVEVDEALAVKLIADASGQKGVLPLVQETLVLLWDKVQGRRLKLEAYKEMGESGRSGLQVAIDRRATTVYHNLLDAAQPIARRIFLRLIQFGEGRADTRRQQTAAELRASGDDPALFDQTLAKLTESRLLTASGDAEGGERRVDIAHEALIAGWPRLQAWLDQRRAAEQTRRRLEAKAAEWVAAEKRGGLLDEYELQEAESWLAGEDGRELGHSQDLVDLAQTSKAKLDQAKAEMEAQQKRELEQAQKLVEEQRLRAEDGEKATSSLRKRLIAATVAVAIAAIAFAAAAWFGVDSGRQRNNAEHALATATVVQGMAEVEADKAVRAAATASVAQGQAETQAQKAIEAQETAVANAAEVQRQKEEAEKASRRARASELAAQAQLRLGQDTGADDVTLLMAVAAVSKTLSIDGYVLSNADAVLRSALGQLTWLRTLQDEEAGDQSTVLFGLSISADGRRLATSGGSIAIWDIASGAVESTLLGHEGLVRSVSFSPDGAMVVSAGDDNTARLWRVDTGQLLVTLSGHTDWVNSAVFSPDGAQVLTASRDNTARLWDASSGALLHVFEGHGSGQYFGVNYATFSPDGKTIATMGDDAVIILWDSAAFSEIRRLLGHEVGQGIRAFSPLGVSSGQFSPDSRLLVTSGGDGTVKVWDTATGQIEHNLIGHFLPVWRATFSADGGSIASAGEDQVVRIWNTETGRQLRVLRGHTDFVSSAVFSPDGGMVIATGQGTIRFWTLVPAPFDLVLRGHSGGVTDAVFVGEDGTIASLAYDQILRIWDRNTGLKLLSIDGVSSSSAFSADGQQVITMDGPTLVSAKCLREAGRTQRPESCSGSGNLTISDGSTLQWASNL